MQNKLLPETLHTLHNKPESLVSMDFPASLRGLNGEKKNPMHVTWWTLVWTLLFIRSVLTVHLSITYMTIQHTFGSILTRFPSQAAFKWRCNVWFCRNCGTRLLIRTVSAVFPSITDQSARNTFTVIVTQEVSCSS